MKTVPDHSANLPQGQLYLKSMHQMQEGFVLGSTICESWINFG